MQIYSSVPKNLLSINEITDKKGQLLSFLKMNKNKFYASKRLSALVGYPTTDSCIELRKAITELIEIDLIPIISTAFGYALVDETTEIGQNQIKTCIKHLSQRKQGIERRINSYFKILKLEDPRKEETEEK